MDRYVIHPEIDEDSRPYWASLREHQARLQKCDGCGRFRFPPSPGCYYCGQSGGRWEPLSGRGRLHSWIVVHHPVDKRLAPEVPFTVALVDLEEGPRVAGRLIGCGDEAPRIGMAVEALYDDVDEDLSLLNFQKAGTPEP